MPVPGGRISARHDRAIRTASGRSPQSGRKLADCLVLPEIRDRVDYSNLTSFRLGVEGWPSLRRGLQPRLHRGLSRESDLAFSNLMNAWYDRSCLIADADRMDNANLCALELGNQSLDACFGVSEQHSRIVLKKQRILYAGKPGPHGSL